MAKRAGAQAAIWSGVPAARSKAAERGVRFFAKPVTLDEISKWITGSLPPDPAGGPDPALAAGDDTGLWKDPRPAGNVIEQGQSVLNNLCKRYGLHAAIWLRQLTETSFGMATHSAGVTATAIKEFLQDIDMSLVIDGARPEQDGTPTAKAPRAGAALRTGSVPGNDSLRRLLRQDWHDKLHHCTFLIREADARPRIVSFFKRDEFSRELLSDLSFHYDHLRHLVQLFRLTEHMESSDTFATSGRILAATVHELRNKAQALGGASKLLVHSLENKKYDGGLADARTLERLSAEMIAMANLDLGQVSKYRQARIKINDVVDTIAVTMRSFRVAKYGYENTQIHFTLDPRLEGLEVCLPPSVIEQPLINLVDNALFHVGDHPWGRIEVETRLSGDADTPVHITVRDNGPGISEAARVNLFTPRETTKPGTGVGMGLYASRNLIRAVGGALECTEHLMWAGSTFRNPASSGARLR